MTPWSCARHTVGLDDALLMSQHAPIHRVPISPELSSALTTVTTSVQMDHTLGVHLQGQPSGVVKLLVYTHVS